VTEEVLKQKEIPLLDLRTQHRLIREEVLAEITRVIDSQQFVLGEEVRRLEEEIADYSQARYAVGCASGTDALYLSLLALNIGPGDEVLTTPYTFFATAGAVDRVGATPVFADIDPVTFNLDIAKAAEILESRPRIKAVIPVHLFGGCCDMDPLLEASQRRGVGVIEDAAQAIGAEYRGRRAGSMGQVGCFSFFPSKNLGGYGDGGMITTNDGALRDRLAALRVHGSSRKYYHDEVGVNSRLDALQAAVLRAKLRYLDFWTEGRQRNAELYRRFLAGAPVRTPETRPFQTRHVYNQFSVLAPRRDELRTYLAENGVGSDVYYPLPLHLQACFARLGYRRGDFPVSERAAAEALALPIYPELGADDVERICSLIRSFYA